MYQGLDLDNYWDGYADPAEPSSGSGRSGLTGSTSSDLQLAIQNQDYGDTGLFTPSYNSGGSYLDTGQGFGVLGLFTPPFRREVAIYDTVHETQCHMDHSGIHVGIQTTQRRHCSLHGTSYRTSGVHMSVGNGGIGIRSFATTGGGSAGRRRGIFGQSNDYPDTGYSDDPYHVDGNYYSANSYSETDEQQGPIITEVDDSEEDESLESNRAIEYKQQSSFTETSRQNSETEVGETRDTKRINKNDAMARSFTRPKNKNTLPERKRSNSETLLQAQNDKTDTRSVTNATTTPTFQLTEDYTIQQTNCKTDVPTLSLGETLDLSVVQQSEDKDYDNERQIDNSLVEESLTKADSNPTDTGLDCRSCMGSQDNKLEDESEYKHTNLSALNVKPFEVGNNENTMTKQELYNSVDSGFPTSNVKPDKETVITDVRPQNKNSLPQRKPSTFESISELEYDIRNNKNAIESSDTRSNVEVTFPTKRPIEDNKEQPPLISNEESHHIGDNLLHELNSDDMPVNDDHLSESTIQFSFSERNDIENTDELSVLNEFQTCDVSELQQAESQDDENDNEPVMEVEKEDRDGYTQAVELSNESSKTQNITTIQEISNFVSSDIPNSVEKHDKLIVDVGIIQNEPVSNINPDLIDEEVINNARTIGTTPVPSEVPNTFPLSDNASKTKSRENNVSRTLGLSKTHILSIDGSEGVHRSTEQNNSDNAITNTDMKDGNERNIVIFKTGDTYNKDKTDKTIPVIPDKEQSFSINKDDGLKDTQNSNAFDQSVEPAFNCDSGDEDEFKSLVTNDRINASKTSIGSSRTSFTNNNYINDNNASHALYLVAEANKPYNEMINNSSSIRNANIGLNFSNSFEDETSDLYRQRKTVKEDDNRYAHQDDLPSNISLSNERATNLKLIQISETEADLKSEILKSANERLKRTNDKDKRTSYANNLDNDHFEGLSYQQKEIQLGRHDQTKSTFQSNTSYGFDLNSDDKGNDCEGMSHNAAESTKATSNNHQVNWNTNKDPSSKTSGASTDKTRIVFNSGQKTDNMEPSPEKIDKTQQNDTNQTTPEKYTYVTDTNANKRDTYTNSDYVKDLKWEYPAHGTTSTHGGNERSFQHALFFYNTSQNNRKPDEHSKHISSGKEKSCRIDCQPVCPTIPQPACGNCKKEGTLHIHTHSCTSETFVICNECRRVLVDEKYLKLIDVMTQYGRGGDPLDHPEWRDVKETLNWKGEQPKQAKKNKNILPDKEARIDPKKTSELSDFDNGQDYKRSESYPKKYNRSTSNMSEKVAKAGLVLKDVHPDGNCLFAAVVDQLRVRGEFFYTTRTLRRAAVTYLREHPRQDDGTELVSYLTDFDGTWDQYLKRMSREGEWGDHLVISAIANILQRRLVIMNNTSDKPTIQIPERPKQSLPQQAIQGDGKEASSANHDHETSPLSVIGNLDVDASKDENKTGPEEASESDQRKLSSSEVKTSEPENTAIDKDEVAAGFEYDDLHLGHISEAHYVSLRHHDWEKKLYDVLSTKTTSCFLSYGHDEQLKTSDLEENLDSNEDACCQTNPESSSFPQSHISFLIKFIRRSNVLPSLAVIPLHERSDQYGSLEYLSDCINGLYGYCPRYEETSSGETGIREIHTIRHGVSSTRQSATKVFTPSDTVVVFTDHADINQNKKDLIVDDTDCCMGYLRLKPVKPSAWKTNSITVNDKTYLSQLWPFQGPEGLLIGFKCEWPTIAEEWIHRHRNANWPSDALKKMVLSDGVRIVPGNHKNSEYPYLEWTISFGKAEKILCFDDDVDEDGITTQTKFCYKILKVVTDFIFEEKNVITCEHLKAVFYDACEQFESEHFEKNPGECLMYMLQKLESCLSVHTIPDYFIREKNLIEHIDSNSISWHFRRLQALRRHFIEHIYVMFMQYGLGVFDELEKCFDGLLEDAQRFNETRDIEETYFQCFLPLNVLQIQKKVTDKDYFTAFSLAQRSFKERKTHMRKKLGDMASFLQGVLKGLTLFEQWLFAFYLDVEEGYRLVHFVCTDNECVGLEKVFGEELVEKLVSDIKIDRSSCQIPVRVAFEGNLVHFAQRFGNILKKEDSKTFLLAMHYFLKKNTEELLLNITKERNEGITYSEHNLTISRLDSMFKSVYDMHQRLNETPKFKELMDIYDILCGYCDSIENYRWLTYLWDSFGQIEKGDVASTKADSIEMDFQNAKHLSTREFGEYEYHMMYALKYTLINGAIVCPNNIREETIKEGEGTDNVTKVKNNKSTLTPYSPLHDELYSFICHLDENKCWTKYGKMVGQTNYSKGISLDMKYQEHPNDTKVVKAYSENNEICSKDLLIDDAHSKAGYTKLIPVDSAIWLNSKVKEKGQLYLKHLLLKGVDNEIGTLSFRSEWPPCAKEWINRSRKHNWPPIDVISCAQLETCQVIASKDHIISSSRIEWKFVFDDAEKILTKSLNEEQKSYFHVAMPLIEHTLGTNFSYQHLRHVFYYVCEELEPDLWLRRPVTAICTVVQRLQSCYKSENLPNYFVAEDNMIEMMSKATLATIVDRLDILIKNMFIMFYFALDEHNQIHFSLFPMYDDVIEDIQHFAGHRSLERSFNGCFLPLTIEGLVLLANKKSFTKLLTQTDKALVDLNLVAPIKLTTERLLLRVVERITPKTVQWLCSFFLDQKLGTMFIESVFSGEETVSISEYFGSELMECLERIHDGDIRIPVELTYVECLPGVVLLFLATLKEELKINVSIVCKGLEYFLSHHKERIVNAVTNPILNAEVRQICKFQIETLQLLLEAENIKEISDEMNRKMKKAKEAVESTKRLLLLAEQHLNGGNVKEAREIILRLKKMPQSENE